MKRTLLMLISILLAASSVFGIIASGSGLDDVSDILRYKRNQKSDLIDFVDVVEDRVKELREAEANRTEEEKEYAETVVTDKVGTQKYDAGKAQYEAGARIAVEKVQSSGARVAILKSKSPSCGCGMVFDGTFSGTLREGWGIAADALRDVGVRVIDENHVANLEE